MTGPMRMGLLIALSVLLLLIAATLQARGEPELRVCPECKYKKLSDALKDIKPGCKVHVEGGKYSDSILIKNVKGVRIELDDGTEVLQAEGSDWLLEIVNSADVSITCRGRCIFEGTKAIRVVDSSGVSIENVDLSGKFLQHLELQGSEVYLDNVSIELNKIKFRDKESKVTLKSGVTLCIRTRCGVPPGVTLRLGDDSLRADRRQGCFHGEISITLTGDKPIGEKELYMEIDGVRKSVRRVNIERLPFIKDITNVKPAVVVVAPEGDEQLAGYTTDLAFKVVDLDCIKSVEVLGVDSEGRNESIALFEVEEPASLYKVEYRNFTIPWSLKEVKIRVVDEADEEKDVPLFRVNSDVDIHCKPESGLAGQEVELVCTITYRGRSEPVRGCSMMCVEGYCSNVIWGRAKLRLRMSEEPGTRDFTAIVYAGGRLLSKVVQLDVEPSYAIIVKVVSEGGSPIPYVKVSIRGPKGTYTTYTYEDGRAVKTGLERGEYTVKVDADWLRCRAEERNVTLGGGPYSELSFTCASVEESYVPVIGGLVLPRALLDVLVVAAALVFVVAIAASMVLRRRGL